MYSEGRRYAPLLQGGRAAATANRVAPLSDSGQRAQCSPLGGAFPLMAHNERGAYLRVPLEARE